MGGRGGERLLDRLGLTVSDDTILRTLKRTAAGVTSDDDLRPAIAEALAQPGPSIVDIVQDRMEGLPAGLVPPAAR